VKDYDETEALERTAGDRELLEDVIRFAVEDIPRIMDDIETALDEERNGDVARLAHKAKGSAGACGAQKLYMAALDLEMAGRDGDPDCRQRFGALKQSFRGFVDHPEIRRMASLDLGPDASIG